ncbi:MAG: succinylglutamate desuccinylase/aspartoacylase family protein [Cyclobacteriaceae bacterium]|nr:succinylglutamate desuccinylase/aspartoacylase family protein [Cyclobacteriaceae bacterium]
MSNPISIDIRPKLESLQRNIGVFKGNKPGPNLIFFGGIHGNELSGIYALKKVLDDLHQTKPKFKGSIYAIAGNLKAIETGKRFIGKDLNRIWFPNTLIPKEERTKVSEYNEKIEILNKLIEILDNGQPTFLFDLHTTSSHSMPFISISDTLKNRRIIKSLPVNLVLGLEELLDGPMFSFFSELGLPAILFEAGQHDAISSYENHVSFIWMTLAELKCVKKRNIPDYHKFVETLKKSSPGGSKSFEIKYRHLIHDQEHFKMKEGFVNFQKVEKGETIAYNKNGKIRSKRTGFIFMPLYQSQGCDGFFIVKEITPFWFKLSSRSRKWKLDKTIKLLPGISKTINGRNTYLIDKNVAKYRVISLLHLLGYRKVKDNGHTLTMSRRPYDTRFPKAAKVRENFKKYLELLKS